LFKTLGVLALLALMASGVILWRLDQGPLPLRQLTPYLADALNDPTSPYHLTIDDLFLTWEGGDSAVELRATGVHMKEKGGGVSMLLPEAALQISPQALLRGELRLRGVEILHPFLHLHRDQDGAVTVGMAPVAEPLAESTQSNDASDILGILVDALSNRRDGPLAELAVVRIVAAEALISDRRMGVDWTIPSAALELYRRGDGGVGLSADLEVSIPSASLSAAPETRAQDPAAAALQLETTHMDVTGTYLADRGHLSLVFGFAGLRPNQLAPLADSLAPLGVLDLPLQGQVGVELSVTKAGLQLGGVGLKLHGGKGVVALKDLGARYAVDGLDLSARAVARPGRSLLDAGKGSALGSALAEVSIESLSLSLVPPGETVKGTSTVTLSGSLTAVDDPTAVEPLQAKIDVAVKNVPVDALGAWWPQAVAPNPRSWVVEHLRNGQASEGAWSFALAGQTVETLEPLSLSGKLHASGVTIDYLPPMPPVVDGVADVTFALERLDVSVISGKVTQKGQEDLVLQGGSVAMTGLHLPDQMTDIDLSVDGSLPAALYLLNSDPLGYTGKLGLDPAQAAGQVKTKVRLVFPPLADLPLEMIDVKAEAEAQNVSLRKAVFGQDLDRGALTLEVSTTELNAKGKAAIGGVPASFTWREVFSGKPYSSRYKVKAHVEEEKRGVFGLTFPPFTPSTIAGPVDADLDVVLKSGGLTTIKADVDLTTAILHLPGFNWHKEAGVPAGASAQVEVVKGDVAAVPHFQVTTHGDLALEGSVALDQKGALQAIMITKAQVGLSSFQGTMTRVGEGYVVDAKGGAFDAVPFIGQSESSPPPEGITVSDGPEDLPPLTLRGQFDKVWVSKTGALDRVQGSARRVNGRWVWANLSGDLGDKGQVRYRLGDAGQGDQTPEQRTFSLSADDTGALMKILDASGALEGGRLRSEGTVDRQGTARGVVSIGSYRLVDAPLLARVLSVAALTGILDSLSGEGIGFDGLYAPFVLTDHAVTIKDFRTSGSALGLTAEGWIDLDNRSVDLAGTIVPAYAVNGLLGRIPLVGGLFSGFTEGGGLIAVTYSIKGVVDDPQISVNPLSALAPGFLKTLFGIGEPDQAAPPSSDKTATPPAVQPVAPSLGE
jgi:hypothetical protein